MGTSVPMRVPPNTDAVMTFVHEGHCACGESAVRLKKRPWKTLHCHCRNCQRFYGQPYSTPSISWRWNVEVTGDIAYTRTWSPLTGASLRRGRCASCREPVVAWGSGALFGTAYVPVQVLKRRVSDAEGSERSGLQSEANLFYGSGEQRDDFGLPTYRTTLSSAVGFTGFLLRALF